MTHPSAPLWQYIAVAVIIIALVVVRPLLRRHRRRHHTCDTRRDKGGCHGCFLSDDCKGDRRTAGHERANRGSLQ